MFCPLSWPRNGITGHFPLSITTPPVLPFLPDTVYSFFYNQSMSPHTKKFFSSEWGSVQEDKGKESSKWAVMKQPGTGAYPAKVEGIPPTTKRCRRRTRSWGGQDRRIQRGLVLQVRQNYFSSKQKHLFSIFPNLWNGTLSYSDDASDYKLFITLLFITVLIILKTKHITKNHCVPWAVQSQLATAGNKILLQNQGVH